MQIKNHKLHSESLTVLTQEIMNLLNMTREEKSGNRTPNT